MPDDFFETLNGAQSLDELMDAMEHAVRKLGCAGFIYWTHLKKPFDELKDGESFYLSRGPAYLKAMEALYFVCK